MKIYKNIRLVCMCVCMCVCVCVPREVGLTRLSPKTFDYESEILSTVFLVFWFIALVAVCGGVVQ